LIYQWLREVTPPGRWADVLGDSATLAEDDALQATMLFPEAEAFPAGS
jgi:hypothetical protein